MLNSLSITWNVWTEEQFYLVVPALQKYVPRFFVAVLLPMRHLLTALPPFGIFPSLHLSRLFIETTYGPILLGVMLAYALDHPRGWLIAFRALGSPLSPLLGLALVPFACSYPREDVAGCPAY